MKWVQIKVHTSRETEDAISNLLMEMGSGGVQIEDNGSDSCGIAVIAYYPPDDMTGERVSKIARLLEDLRELDIDVGAGRIIVDSLDERDWSERWKEFFKPLPVGKRILVFTSWENVSESPPRDVLIQIDPGMAFGTGRHPTTTLCLEMLEHVMKGGEDVLDFGTGSGILAIAAAKLGARRVISIDVDEKATAVAKENSELNNVNDKIRVICAEQLGAVSGKYDIIVSNISTKVIIPVIPDFGFHLDAHGILILSGILEHEAPEVRKGLECNDFVILDSRRDQEWAAFLAKASE